MPSLDQQTRKQLREGNPIGNSTLKCYQGVWNAKAVENNPENELDQLLREDREEFCLFYPYKPNVFPAAAKHFERRDADRREAKQDRKWAKIAVWVAAGALILNLAWSMYQHFSSPRADRQKAAVPQTQHAQPSCP